LVCIYENRHIEKWALTCFSKRTYVCTYIITSHVCCIMPLAQNIFVVVVSDAKPSADNMADSIEKARQAYFEARAKYVEEFGYDDKLEELIQKQRHRKNASASQYVEEFGYDDKLEELIQKQRHRKNASASQPKAKAHSQPQPRSHSPAGTKAHSPPQPRSQSPVGTKAYSPPQHRHRHRHRSRSSHRTRPPLSPSRSSRRPRSPSPVVEPTPRPSSAQRVAIQFNADVLAASKRERLQAYPKRSVLTDASTKSDNERITEATNRFFETIRKKWPGVTRTASEIRESALRLRTTTPVSFAQPDRPNAKRSPLARRR